MKDRSFDWPDKPKCDFCDLPATQGIRDVYEQDPQHLARSGDSEIYIRKSYPGPWRFVCDEHKERLGVMRHV